MKNPQFDSINTSPVQSAHFHEYVVYSDGRIWSNYRERFLKPDIVKDGYEQVTLSIDKKSVKFKVHRLVALMFIPNPDNLPQINHIDGNKQNNNISNLEWCTAYHNNKHARDMWLNDVSGSNSRRWTNPVFRSKTSKRLSEAKITSGACAGENNPRFRYRINFDGMIITRKELSFLLDRCQSATDAMICKAAHGKQIKLFLENNISVIDLKRV